MVDPRIMCRQHLLGEHAEIHMFVGTLNRQKSVKGYLQKGYLEVHSLFSRHAELVEEIERRRYKHCSKIDERWKTAGKAGFVDGEGSLKELVNRCPKCKSRYLELLRLQ